MAADKAFMEHVVDLLSSLGGISSRSMFGGYGIFSEGNMFALISGATLFFKVDDSNISNYTNADSKQYKPMPYYEVPAALFEDVAKLQVWAQESIAIAASGKKKKK